MCCGAIQKRGPSEQAISLQHLSDRQRCRHSPLLHANGNCSLYLKKKVVLCASSSSVAQCTGSDSVNPCSSSKEVENKSFCWNGFCARDLFKHSEAKWRVLPSLFSEALELGTTVYKSGTLVLTSRCPLIFQSQTFQTGHGLVSHVIIIYRAS